MRGLRLIMNWISESSRMAPKCGLEIIIQIGADRNGRPKYIDYF